MSDEATVLPEVLARQNLSVELARQSDESIAMALIDALPDTDLARCAVQREIVNKDPGRWYSICNAALHVLTKGFNERVPSLLIEAVNGYRRTKSWAVAEAIWLLSSAENCIAQLLEGPRRDRLSELHAYHGGLVYYAAGDFKKAAECLRTSARFSKDEPNRLWNLYLAAYYEFIAVFVAGAPGYIGVTVEVGRAANDLKAVLNLQTPLHAQWFLNMLYHEIRRDWYMGLEINPRKAHDFRELMQFEQLPAFMDAQGFLLALQWIGQDYSDGAFDTAQLIATYGVEPDARGDSWLLCAQIAFCEGKTGQARACLIALRDLQMNGGHLAKAVGARMLAKLEAGE